MTPSRCPNCGAPAQAPPGSTAVHCTFCGTAIPAEPPPQQPAARPIIVVAPGAAYGAQTAATVARSAGTRALLGIVPFVVVLLAGGLGTMSSLRASQRALGIGGSWTGATPLSCAGNDSVDVAGVTASFAFGSAINAGGNCHVTCRGCTLKAPIAVTAGDNANVDLVDSHVEGTTQSIVAGGNASVRVTGNSTLTGPFVKGGNASIIAPPAATGTSKSLGAPPSLTSGSSPAAPSHGPSKHH